MATNPAGSHLVVAMTSNSRVITLASSGEVLACMSSGGPSPDGPGPLAFDPSDGSLAMFVNNELTRWNMQDDGKLTPAEAKGKEAKLRLREGKGLRVSNMTFDMRGRLLIDGEPNCWVEEGKVEALAGPPQVDLGDGEMQGPDIANDALFALPEGPVLLQNGESLSLFILEDGKVVELNSEGGIPINSRICVSPLGHIVCVGVVYNTTDDLPAAQVTVLRRGHAEVVTRLQGLPDFEEIEEVCVDANGKLSMCVVLEWPDNREIFQAMPMSPTK